MTEEDLRVRILARRAAFVAAAMAGLAGTEACRTTVPAQTVTIEPVPVTDAAAPTASATPPTRDAGTPPPIETSDYPPAACLSMRRP